MLDEFFVRVIAVGRLRSFWIVSWARDDVLGLVVAMLSTFRVRAIARRLVRAAECV